MTHGGQDHAGLQTSTRDHEVLRSRLEAWLVERLPGASISDLAVPQGNGLSSETVLFEVALPTEETPRSLVARIAPDPAADPLFPRYDMALQFRAMQMVARHTDVPVPTVYWLETDAAAVGAPFFVMERVEGDVPPDVMPYTFGDNWLFAATRDEQLALEHRTVAVLAALHELSAVGPADSLFGQDDSRTSLRRHVDDQRDYYAWVASDGTGSPLIERGFRWLEEHWPEDEGEPVFNWGDARIGNIVFRKFAPVAVLDWEMASVGPRELDIGWMVYTHRFFQDLAEDIGLPGLPNMFLRSAVAAYYEHLTRYAPRDLDFYTTYGALRHAIVMFRIPRRQAHLGETTFPENPDHAILYHAHLRRMLDDAYWATVAGA